MRFRNLEIDSATDLIFGSAPHPVRSRRGLEFGGGHVYPELNFTLPPMEVSRGAMPELVRHYTEIATGALERAVQLHSRGVVLEFETLIEMTREPAIGAELVEVMSAICDRFYERHGLPCEIRLTPNDLREFERPPRQRTSGLLDATLELFERGARAGGDLLSIESTGGKEISDDALMACDARMLVFSQAVLGARDVEMLWDRIVAIAHATGRLAGGDTACACGNTAMVLAERKYIPRVFAAVARVATVVRTLAAVERGARGPDKDCGYEGPFLKAIAGIPISMEGKAAACAHFSPVGNVTAACADLWSNESVQNVKLLAGMAPTVSLEQLEYDTRLLNQALASGRESALALQKLLVDSDVRLDPQALVLAPTSVIRIAAEIVRGENRVDATRRGCLAALDLIAEAAADGSLELDRRELPWIQKIRGQIESIPPDEGRFVDQMLPRLDSGKVLLSEYGL
jgi:methanol---5-hydroxybenzimidazolylcobamide Co-methyltransferase